MATEDIKNKIKNLDQNTVFFLVKLDSDSNSADIIKLEDTNKEFVLESDYLLINNKGKLLKTLIDSSNRVKYSIDFVKGNTIIISKNVIRPRKIGPVYKKEKTTIYTLKDELKEKKTFINTDEEHIESVEFASPTNDDILIVRMTSNEEKQAYLYSISKDEAITPKFTSIESLGDNKTFKYTDTVKSNETINGEKEKTNIIGFININGFFLNEIYDESINSTRKIELNSHSNFIQYNALKRLIARELDKKVEKEVEQYHCKNQTLKRLELKAKTTYIY